MELVEMRFFSHPISALQGDQISTELYYNQLCNTAQLNLKLRRINFTFIHGYIKAVLDIEIEINKCFISQSIFKEHDHFGFAVCEL